MALTALNTFHLRGMSDSGGSPGTEIATVKVTHYNDGSFDYTLDKAAASGTVLLGANPTATDTLTLNGKVWTFVASGATGNQTNITKDFGSIQFSANPTATDTIVLNGVTWTFVAAGAAGNQTNVGGSLAATLTQLVSDLQGSADAGITPATYTESGGDTLVITHDTTGDQSAYTISVAGLTAAPTAASTALGGGLAATLTQFKTDLNASGDTSIDDATYGESGGTTLTITHDTLGVAGNAYTMVDSGMTVAATLSGATLNGGDDGLVYRMRIRDTGMSRMLENIFNITGTVGSE